MRSGVLEIYNTRLKMQNNELLNPRDFVIAESGCEDTKKAVSACQKLIKSWTPELENQMLKAFVKLYYDKMYQRWGPDDEEESEEYWPKIKSPADLIKYTGTEDVTLFALEDATYVKSKSQDRYESRMGVILELNCPWDEDHGWAALFADEKFVMVDCLDAFL